MNPTERVAAWRDGLRKKRGARKKESVDLGLEVIAALTPPGVTWTLRDIADVCDCSVGLVREIEQRALRKLRQTANDPS